MRFVDTINVTEDATIASKVKEYEKFLSSELDIAIGKTNTELDSRKKNSSSRGSCNWQPDSGCYA
jgi:hypothetical protein